MSVKLFAVHLGGTAPGANTELHDVVFATGNAIEDTYEQLLEKWFGSPNGLHIDSWVELDVVDGRRVTLSPEPDTGSEKLFFINLGAYRDQAPFPGADRAFARALALPFATSMTEAECDRVALALARFV